MYDIIGDIHGKAEALKLLLHKLGYDNSLGCYQHPDRKAVFLGDYINKGPASREVLGIVRHMTACGKALALIGNHELYLVGLFSRHRKKDFVRPHTAENVKQQQATFDSFQRAEDQLYNYIAWLRTLPLYLQLEGCRLVHAFWHQKSIRFLQQHYPENCLSERLLYNMVPYASPEWDALSELTRGVRLPEPADGSSKSFKAKWWCMDKSRQYADLATRSDNALGDREVSVETDVSEYSYAASEPPLFFGHYNLPGLPYLTGQNHCCLDFSPDYQDIVTAYRWQGEQQLEISHFVY